MKRSVSKIVYWFTAVGLLISWIYIFYEGPEYMKNDTAIITDVILIVMNLGTWALIYKGEPDKEKKRWAVIQLVLFYVMFAATCGLRILLDGVCEKSTWNLFFSVAVLVTTLLLGYYKYRGKENEE